jgi:hypothetical protein
MKGAGPAKYSLSPKLVESNRVLVAMENMEWEELPEPDSLFAYLKGYEINIEKRNENYLWQISNQLSDGYGHDKIKVLASGQETTQIEAQKSAVKFVIGSGKNQSSKPAQTEPPKGPAGTNSIIDDTL